MQGGTGAVAPACEQLPREEGGCHCGALNSTAPLRHRRGRSHASTSRAWGLPSEGCLATNWTTFLVRDYPALHRQWRAEGRVLEHCSRSTGLGDYLRSLPSALVFSALTELALTLRCGAQLKDEGRPSTMHAQVATYFTGPHFDWDFDSGIGAGEPPLRLEGQQMRAWGRWRPLHVAVTRGHVSRVTATCDRNEWPPGATAAVPTTPGRAGTATRATARAPTGAAVGRVRAASARRRAGRPTRGGCSSSPPGQARGSSAPSLCAA